MFEIFGEFDSAAEINLAAKGLFDEGDLENIYKLASENGIDREYAQMYIEGDIPFLTDSATAAMGKIDIELEAARKSYGSVADCVAEYIKSLCDRDEFAGVVRKKGRSLSKCLDLMRDRAKQSLKSQTGTQCACIPPSEGFRLIRDYYERGAAS